MLICGDLHVVHCKQSYFRRKNTMLRYVGYVLNLRVCMRYLDFISIRLTYRTISSDKRVKQTSCDL